MGKIISAVIITLFCLQAVLVSGMEILCRYCNLSVPFHGCLLDGGVCRTDPGQYCKDEYHKQGGIKWLSVKGCTTTKEVCHSRKIISNTIHFTYCCRKDMCNL